LFLKIACIICEIYIPATLSYQYITLVEEVKNINPLT